MSASQDTPYLIKLTNVRISYPHLFAAWAQQANQKPKFSAKFLLSKTEHKAQVQQIIEKIKALAAETYKDKRLPSADKLCLRDGDQTNRPEEEGYFTFNASDDRRPQVFDRDGRTPLTEADDKIFAGCRVNAMVQLWAQDNQYGRRINANLIGVQYVRDDERLAGARPSADGAFDDISDAYGDDDDGLGEDPFGL